MLASLTTAARVKPTISELERRIQTLTEELDLTRLEKACLQEENQLVPLGTIWEASAVSHPPEWFESFPYAKRLLSPPGYDQEVDGRDYQLFEARERIQTWFPFYHYTPEIEAFLHLIEALEREREFSIALYGGHTLHFLALDTELRLAEECAPPRVMAEYGSHEIQCTAGFENNIPLGTIPESFSSSDISTAHEPEQPKCPTATQLVQPQSETEEIISSPRNKDVSKFKFKCEKCEKSYTRSTTLQEHKRSHNNERRWACQLCPRRFVRLKDRNRHQKSQHAEKTIECGLPFQLNGMRWKWGCHQRFAREDGLVSHLRTAKGWRCLEPILESDEYLAFLQFTPGLLASHEIQCSPTGDSCQKLFKDPQQLRQHLSAPPGRKCATGWLINNVLKIYRGMSLISVDPSRQEQPSSAPNSTNSQDEGSDDDDANGDRETSSRVSRQGA
ncbi:hypothetical protein L207DRAFT_593272 [Hyaloscypha variabilis F]|uniref:C2H2-type domain-containing protein n=1 Tax=Hyaloscypha variabilis (strain UAMH 11265 / GT02V1 / F) TaxID=1149755 RepID=A0A2J6QTW5_HYAVF|nr:hypothetical protein L207DRAFT_593272 [Hyaloscypha variabilis F]